MEQDFPPGRAILEVQSFVTQTLLLLAFLGVLTAFLMQLRQRTTAWQIAGWVFGGTGLTVLSVWSTIGLIRLQSGLSGSMQFSVLAIALLCVVGFLHAVMRLRDDQKTRPLTWVMICCGLTAMAYPFVMLPKVSRAGTAARRTLCRNNLKHIGLGLHNYHDEYNEFPPTAHGTFPISWRVQILPYIDQAELYKAYDVDQPWNQPPNDALIRTPLSTYACPSSPIRDDKHFTAYIAPTANDTILRPDKSLNLGQIQNDPSNALMVVEACGLEIPWPEPRDFELAKQPLGMNLTGKGKTDSPGVMSSYHIGGAHAAAADGSVRFLSEKIDPKVLKQLLSANRPDTPIPEEY